MAWDAIDEVADHQTWVYSLTGKVMESAFPRYQVPAVGLLEDVDYRHQDHPDWWNGAAGLMAKRETLDYWFPELGPCLICGTGLDQRHRVLDAICDRVSAGDPAEMVAEDYGLPVKAIEVALAQWDPETGTPRITP